MAKKSLLVFKITERDWSIVDCVGCSMCAQPCPSQFPLLSCSIHYHYRGHRPALCISVNVIDRRQTRAWEFFCTGTGAEANGVHEDRAQKLRPRISGNEHLALIAFHAWHSRYTNRQYQKLPSETEMMYKTPCSRTFSFFSLLARSLVENNYEETFALVERALP